MKIVADENIPFVKECFSSLGQVCLFEGRKITFDKVKDADVLLVRSVTKVNKELLEGGNVKFVGTATIGVDHIDQNYLKERGIGFSSAPGSNSNSVAEYVVAGLLEVSEKYNIELEGLSIGIIGVGNVGSKVYAKAKALGLKTVLNDPPKKRETGDEKYRELNEVYECDIVTIHTPLTFEGVDQTYHLADEEFFSNLKDGVIFFNTSRGGVVDTGSLKGAFNNCKVKSAVLDVWENEPEIDTELLEMTDIGTPHIAGYSFDGKVTGMMMIYDAVTKFFDKDKKYSLQNFLPEPQVKEINLNQSNDQRGILEAVRKLYDIREDDRRLRKILNETERGEYFTFLRKTYPVRREFPNTLVKVNDNFKLKNKLEGIGFKVEG